MLAHDSHASQIWQRCRRAQPRDDGTVNHPIGEVSPRPTTRRQYHEPPTTNSITGVSEQSNRTYAHRQPASINTMTRAIFTTRITQLAQYVAKHGHTDVPYAQAPLGQWVGYIRRRKKAGLLSDEQVAALEQIPGWSWHPRKSGGSKKMYLHLEVQELRSRRLSLQEIADITKISRQRVHQILKENK